MEIQSKSKKKSHFYFFSFEQDSKTEYFRLGTRSIPFSRVYSKCTRMAIMLILASEALFHENKKIQLQNATLVSIEPLDL